MSEATAVIEEVAPPPDSEVAAPASETVETPPSTPEAVQDGTGAPGSDTGTEPESAPKPDLTPEERHAELLAKLDKEGLTPQEGQELRRVTQSVTDRRADEDRRIQAVRDRENQTREAAKNLDGAFMAQWNAITDLDADGNSRAPADVQRSRDDLLSRYAQAKATVHQFETRSHVIERIRAQQPQSSRLEEWMAQAPVTELVDFLERIPRPPSPDHVILTTKERDKLIADAKQEVHDSYKAQGVGPPTIDSSNTTPAPVVADPRHMNDEQYEAWKRTASPEEQMRVWSSVTHR